MSEKKDYTKETVLIEDNLLKEMGNIIGIGVMRREKEIHLEFYIEKDGLLFHRDIEVQPDGEYDSGSLLKQDWIADRLKKLKQ